MFDITGDYITRLNDEDLRELVTRLCEAELRRANLPLASLTSGGNQNAADGGVDVRIELPDQLVSLDFIPKGVTGFQVKKPDMPASKIQEEMRPDGVLRPAIVQLGAQHGAYIIVSAQGSVADGPLQNRKKAMQSAIADLPQGMSLHLDFYDRDRLARWVRDYLGVALWLRERLGEPLAGWRTYGNWAFGDPKDSEYLLDDKCRIVAPQTHLQLTVEQGIQSMRATLKEAGGVVRLVGLSGTGKTRLAQALFDPRIGSDTLDRATVAYVDQGSDDPPTPSARDMIHRLSTEGIRAILVVDNCNPVTHRELAQSVRTAGGLINLITIEYDVSDDEPEETHVFRLEPASEKIIEEILGRLIPNLSQANCQHIANFSGGNARVALALARTVEKDENLGTLRDAELFRRLFHQRQESGDALMRAAEVCSLIYSFDGETTDGESAELTILAELAGIPTNELFRHANTLRSRDLIQRRSKWRAVLPHAIANRLARQALNNIPTGTIIHAFSKAGRERLLKSFSRRLGYLHDCEQAIQIAEAWLTPENGQSNLAQLNDLGLDLFNNLAPIAPEAALCAIESTINGEGGKAFVSVDTHKRWMWCNLLRSIAYEPQYFNRAVLLLAKYVAKEPLGHNYNSARSYFIELFHLYLSGTHAPVEHRLEVIRQLLSADNAALNSAGIEALGAMMETMHFHSSHDFSFGARPRDFGWEPATGEDTVAWFRAVIAFARNQALSNTPHTQPIKALLAQHFRGLWLHAGVCAELEQLSKDFSVPDRWSDGWLSIREVIYFDIEKMSPEFADRTRLLESELRPQSLEQKIGAYLLSDSHRHFDLVDMEAGADESSTAHDEAWQRICRLVENLAIEANASPATLNPLLPRLLCKDGPLIGQFGRGLVKGAQDVELVWQQLCDIFETLPESERNVALLQGVIASTHELAQTKANLFLDMALSAPALAPLFPLLQTSINIDETGTRRIISSISSGLAQPWTYAHLGYGRASDAIPLPLFREILLGISALQNGYRIAVDVFGMRLHSLKCSNIDIDLETTLLGRELLILNDYSNNNANHAYRISEIAAACLKGKNAHDDAIIIARNLAKASRGHHFEVREYGKLISTLFQLQPLAAIQELLKPMSRGRSVLYYITGPRQSSPANAAPPEILMKWAMKSPKVRMPILAEEVHLFAKNGENDTCSWSPLALGILEVAPDRKMILEIYADRFYPRSWSGSLADVLIPYLSLTKELQSHKDPLIAAWANEQAALIKLRIEEDRKRERRQDESFE